MKFILCYYIVYLCYFLVIQRSMLTHVYINFLDVGQGDASIIASKHSLVVIDGGPNYTIDYYIDNQVPFFACSIDFMVISHPHYDHIAGLTRLVRRCDVKNVIFYDTDYSSKEWDTLKMLMAGFRNMHTFRGRAVQLSSNELLRVLWPPQGFVCGNVNDCSVVVSYETNGQSVLYMGDVSASVTGQLEFTNKPILVKLPHHGARSTLTENFLSSVSPFTGIVSFGIKNKFGHPHQETLNLLAKFGSQVIKTSEGSYLVKLVY